MTPTRQEVTKLIKHCERYGASPIESKIADALTALLDDNERYRSCLWWLVEGGEFSHWFISSDVSLPVAAMKEWEEARKCFPELAVEDEPAPQETGGSMPAGRPTPAGAAPIEPVGHIDKYNRVKCRSDLPKGTKIYPESAIKQLATQVDALKADADRYERSFEWLIRNLFECKWDGTIGVPSTWSIRGDYRHTMQKLSGVSLLDAIDAAMKQEKE